MVVGNAVGVRKNFVRKKFVRMKFVRMKLVQVTLLELGSGFEREVELDHWTRKRWGPNGMNHCRTEKIICKNIQKIMLRFKKRNTAGMAI